ncbi:hypothetical protein C2E31_14610 [Rhodopirellula baltica]|nr:hypothetical protein C2E31_14610 [Rhodopirellula baltica]
MQTDWKSDSSIVIVGSLVSVVVGIASSLLSNSCKAWDKLRRRDGYGAQSALPGIVATHLAVLG